MSRIIFNKLLILGIPAIVIIATWFLAPQISTLTPSRQEIVVLSPYLITALGIFLSVHFHRGRPLMVLLLLIAFYWCSRKYLSGKLIELSLNQIYQAFVLLIPANFALIAIMRERGIFSTASRLRFIVLAVEAVFAFWLFHYQFINILPYIAGSHIQLKFLNSMLVPEPAIVITVICFILITALVVERQAPVDSGILGALTAFFIASNWITDNYIHSAFCAAGAAIITLSVLRDSYNMAFRDDLTGLPSRRSLNEALHGIGGCYTIAMLDVDHFKNFNDTYGHNVGDQVLKMVAQIMQDVGGGGKAYRYGGEEFTILFSGCKASDAIPHLEEVRKNIAGYKLALRNEDRPKKQSKGKSQRSNRNASTHVSVTISIGVSERSNNVNTTDEVMKSADKALYRAKSKGRNQVCY